MNPTYLLVKPIKTEAPGATEGIFKRTSEGWIRIFDKSSKTGFLEPYNVTTYHTVETLRRYYHIEYLTEEEVFAAIL